MGTDCVGSWSLLVFLFFQDCTLRKLNVKMMPEKNEIKLAARYCYKRMQFVLHARTRSDHCSSHLLSRLLISYMTNFCLLEINMHVTVLCTFDSQAGILQKLVQFFFILSQTDLCYDICEQQRRRLVCAFAQSCYSRNCKSLASLCSWRDWFESDLVENHRKHVFAWCGSYCLDWRLFQFSSTKFGKGT